MKKGKNGKKGKVREDKIIITWSERNHGIRIDVEDEKTLKEMIARLVIDHYPKAVVYHHGTAVRFRL
jgi:hypothetical protein